jgi:hypothetical protein
MTPDQKARDQIRRDAIACGWSAHMAAWIASQTGKEAQSLKGATPKAMQFLAVQGPARPRPKTRNDRIDAIVSLFGGSQALAADLKVSTATPRAVVAWLADATGSAPRISAGGIAQVRMQAFAHDRKGSTH